MASGQDTTGLNHARIAQLRHDLLNPLNVLTGAAAALLDTELTATQRTWVQMVRSTTNRLVEIVAQLSDAPARAEPSLIDGRAMLADLLSIAAARVSKPFDRERLVSAIEHVGGDRALRVLLVDDSPELVALVRTFLKGKNWDLDVVENGERAVAQATSEPYDVVLMDIDLPGLDGATAAHAIRAADLARGASPTPIIAMTAFDFAADDQRGQQPPAGATAEPQSAGLDRLSEVVTIEDPEIAPLVPGFLENRRADVTVFKDAVQAADFRRVESLAHRMKGTGRGFGFVVISRIGGDLEVAAQEQDQTKVLALIDELEGYLTRVRVATV
jgi:CheY-like chemotaxis protein